MIYEYALDPELVATWGSAQNYRYFFSKFGFREGRFVSRYPKVWFKKVWDAYDSVDDEDRKRLQDLLIHLKFYMINRKNCCWDNQVENWLKNVLNEHTRYPFWSILSRKKTENLSYVTDENELNDPSCKIWDTPHGAIVHRNASEMTKAIETMLSLSHWVKFVDPNISPGKMDYRLSLSSFLDILKNDRPVGPPKLVEIHIEERDTTPSSEWLKKKFKEIIPYGLNVTLYRWKERPMEQKLHNRYILTDLGGISFHYGLDVRDGDIDDISRLDFEQYSFRCEQYDVKTAAFNQALPPLKFGKQCN